MKNRKSIIFLLLVLVALAVANFTVYHGRASVKNVRRDRLVELDVDVDRITVEKKGLAATVLERSGREWKFVSPFAGMADRQVVARFLDGLSERISDVISDSDLLKLGRSRADFLLDEPALRVRIASGKRVQSFGFGMTTPSNDGVYVAVDGVDAVFVVPVGVHAAADVSADGFRRRALVLREDPIVTSFDIRRGSGSLMDFTSANGEWRVRNAPASVQKVTKFLSDLLAAQAKSFVWPVGVSNETEIATTSLLAGYGLDADSAVTVNLKSDKGEDCQIAFGREAGEGLVYAFVQNGGAIAMVSSALKDAASQDAVMFTDSRIFQTDARSVSFFSLGSANGLHALVCDKSGQWRLESPIMAPADKEVVAEVLNRILSLSASDVTAAEGVVVSVSTNAPGVRVFPTSVLGKHAYEDLRSKTMLQVDPALVKRIVRSAGDKNAKSIAVVYDRDRRMWNVESGAEGATAKTEGVEAILSAIGSLTAVKVEKLKPSANDLDAFGLGNPHLKLAIDQVSADSVRRNIIVGKKTDGGRFATIGSSDAVFVISDAVVEKLVQDIATNP